MKCLQFQSVFKYKKEKKNIFTYNKSNIRYKKVLTIPQETKITNRSKEKWKQELPKRNKKKTQQNNTKVINFSILLLNYSFNI